MAATLKRRRLLRRLIALFVLSLITFAFNPSRTSALLRNAIETESFRPEHSPHVLLIVTAVNYAFRDSLTNMACTMSRNAQSKAHLLLLALETRMHQFAKQRGYHFILLGGADGHEHIFGSRTFNLLSKLKLHAVYFVLRTGVDVLFVDANIV